MTDIDKFDMFDFSPDLLLNYTKLRTKRYKLRIRYDLPPLIINTKDDGSLEILLGTQEVAYYSENPFIGILIWYSVDAGKFCKAIANSQTAFHKQNYTMLWATRNALTNDNNKLEHKIKEEDKNTQIVDNHKSKAFDDGSVKSNIRTLVGEAKLHMTKIKTSINEIRQQIKKRNLFKTEIITDNNTTSIRLVNERIDKLQLSLKNDMEIYTTRVQKIKKLLKTNLSDLERSVVKMVLKDEQKTMRAAVKMKKKELVTSVQVEKKAIKQTMKKRQKIYLKLRKTLKKTISEEKKNAKKIKKAEEKLRKTLRKQEGFRQEFKDDTIKGLANKYAANIDSEIEKARSELLGKESAKLKKAANKVAEKEAKKQQKIADRETRKREKAAEKEARKQTRKKK